MKKLFIIISLLFGVLLTSANAVEVSLEAKVTGLYVAFFNRAADQEGLSYWTEEAQNSGEEVSDVFRELSAGFAEHPTFNLTYSELDNRAFVEAIYRNALGRDGDEQGINYWADNALGEGMSRSDMVAIFVNAALTGDLTPQNFPGLTAEELATAQLRQDLITNKVTASLAFTHQLGELSNVADSSNPENDPAYLASIAIISKVTEEGSSVDDVLAFLDKIKENEDQIAMINGVYLGAADFTIAFDTNEPEVISNWKVLSTMTNEGFSATILRQGSYGAFTVADGNLTYLRTADNNNTDSGILKISNAIASMEIEVSVISPYWKQISVREGRTMGIQQDGTLWGWGNNRLGQLGIGTKEYKNFPTQEAGKSSNWKSVSAGVTHTVALKTDGTIWAWGYNFSGQLGDGIAGSSKIKLFPGQEKSKASDWAAVSAGGVHTIALKEDGTLWGWGANRFGQLGDGSWDIKAEPVQESTKAADWVRISTGRSHTVAIKADGTLWSWGDSQYGQLGDGVSGQDSKSNIPVQETTESNDWEKAGAGREHTAAIKTDGTLWAWGRNDKGQVGDGTSENNISIPVQEATLSENWSSVDGGEYHTVATKADGTLWAWGWNVIGQLGDGTKIDRHTPVQEYTKAKDWSSGGAGLAHSAALKENGTLWSWGYNLDGQLGDGTMENHITPERGGYRSE